MRTLQFLFHKLSTGTIASIEKGPNGILRLTKGNASWRGVAAAAAGSTTTTTTTRLYHSTAESCSSDASDAVTNRLCAARAQAAVNLLPTYLADARACQKFCPDTALDGALQLSVAENKMLEDLLIPSIKEFSSTADFPADAIYYQPTHGRESFRMAMAAYLEDLLQLSSPMGMDPEGIVVGAGCNAVLENLCLCLAGPSEGVLIPTPYYAAFEFDLVARAGLSIVPVNTMDYQDFDENDNSSIPPHAYYPNRASLDAAVARSIQDGIVPRILLLSHPQNPLGICYPPHVVTEIIDWCRDHKIHLISDEIYAGSIYRPEDAEFVSALELASTTTTTTKSSSSSDDDDEQQQQQKNQYLGLGPYVHLVYALSKDFALSGLRVGALYSENAEIRVPLQKLNDLSCISSHTQILVERMLTATTTDDDDDLKVSWTKRFLSQNHQRLQARGDAWHSCLDDLQIPYLKATAGLFVWMDFSEFLPNDGSSDEERERALYLDLLHGHGLLFTPGHSMKNERPGFFRCVFTAASEQEFALGMERLRKYVHAKRG